MVLWFENAKRKLKRYSFSNLGIDTREGGKDNFNKISKLNFDTCFVIRKDSLYQYYKQHLQSYNR